jgi:hypothetical protein
MSEHRNHSSMTATAWFLAGLGAIPFLAMALAAVISPGIRRCASGR